MMDREEFSQAVYEANAPCVAHLCSACPKDGGTCFFPDTIRTELQEHVAIELCKTCPFMEECYEQAMTHGEVYGVWGGTTAKQRKKLLEKQGKYDPLAAQCESCGKEFRLKSTQSRQVFCERDCYESNRSQRAKLGHVPRAVVLGKTA